MNCLFCKISQKEIPSNILYEDDKIIAFLDINQQNIGHTLVIPKDHIEDITKISDEDLIKLFSTAKNLGNIIIKKLNAQGLTYSINYGDAQEIKHLHLHICPYYKNKQEQSTINDIYNQIKSN